MVIKNVKLVNFKSYAEQQIGLPMGRIMIIGQNGAGKTTLLEAIHFGLFGKSDRKNIELIRQGAKKATIEVSFSSQKGDYTVKRSLIMDRNSVNHEAFMKDSLGNIIANNPTSVLIEVEKILSTTENIFRNAVYVGQGEIAQIAFQAPSERKKLLDRLLGLQIYENAWEKSREIMKEIRGRIKRLEDEIKMLKEEVDKKSLIQEKLQKEKTEVKKNKESLQNLEKSLKQLSKDYDEKKKIKDDLIKVSTEREKIEESLKNLNNDEKRFKTTLEKDLGEKWAEKIKSLGEVEEKINDLEKHLETIENDLKVKTEKIDDEKQKTVKTLAEETQKSLQELRGEKDLLKRKIGGFTANLEALEDQKKSLSSLKEETTCPTCQQKLTPQHVEKILLENEKKYSEIKTEKDSLEKILRKLEEKETMISKSFEKHVSKIEIESKEKKENFHKNFKEEKQKLSKDIKNMRNLQKRLETGKTIHKELENVLKKLKSEKDLFKSVDERFQELNSSFDAVAFKHLEDEVKKQENQKAKLETSIDLSENKLIPEFENQLETINKKEQELREKEEKLSVEKQKLQLTDTLRNLFRDIQPVIRDALVESISEEATKTFKELINTPEFDQLKLTSDYDIQCYRYGIPTDIRLLSGGEQIIACLALRLGVAEVIGRQDLLILDEPTVHLDQEHRIELVDVLSYLKSVPQLIVVTHDPTFANAAETILTIEKTGNGSSIHIES
ncbi:MAG: AAA family ATPase [Candidatus Hodarchaeota archaeon]